MTPTKGIREQKNPYEATQKAILLAYSCAADSQVPALLGETFQLADPKREFLQIAAFRLQAERLMAYLPGRNQRVMNVAGRAKVIEIRMQMQKEYGRLTDTELIALLEPAYLNELNAWHIRGLPQGINLDENQSRNQ